MGIYQRQIRAFRRKFGREMLPQDPFFFNPAVSTPEFRPPDQTQFALDVLAELLVESGIDPAAIYAFKATGGLFPDAAAPFTPLQQIEWDIAIQEYHARLRCSATQ